MFKDGIGGSFLSIVSVCGFSGRSFPVHVRVMGDRALSVLSTVHLCHVFLLRDPLSWKKCLYTTKMELASLNSQIRSILLLLYGCMGWIMKVEELYAF